MAVTPVVLCLNRAGEATAHRVAKLLGAAVHGREDRVDAADVLFANALDHTRMLFQAGTPVIGVCASGILIRAKRTSLHVSSWQKYPKPPSGSSPRLS